MLGERETGTKRLQERLEAFRKALNEFTRERVPVVWGATQASLGNVLQTLGERESGTKCLEEALEAYRQRRRPAVATWQTFRQETRATARA